MSGIGAGFAVDPDALGAHAAAVGELAAALRATAEAARPLDADAYGMVGRSFAQWAVAAAARADRSVDALGRTLSTFPSALADSAQGYVWAEDAAVEALRGVSR